MSYGNNQPPLVQNYPAPRSSNNVFIIIALCMIPVLLVCSGILLGLLLPAVQAAREAARRMQCSNNLREIGLALHNYNAAYGSLPPAYTVDANGNKLHSWRTLILPFIEQQAMYNQIDLSKPWNDPANAMFNNMVVPTYACPSSNLSPGSTTYQVVVDPSSVFPGATSVKLTAVTDGTSNTLAVVESSPADAVLWMEPGDLDLPTFIGNTQGKTVHTGGFNVLFTDASVRFIAQSIDPKTLQDAVTMAGGEPAMPQ